MRILILVMMACAGCGNDTQMMTADLAMPASDLSMAMPPVDMAFNSACGQPGDPGNNIGVGKFCVKQSDCNSGTFCAHSFDSTQYFCTVPCSSGGSATQCGTGATCACQGGQCGCVPTACLGTPQG